MKTIKLIAAIAIAFATSVVCAEDSYLYWMVENVKSTEDNTDINFEYATIRTDSGSSYLSLYSPSDMSQSTFYLLSNNGGNSSSGAPAGVYAGFSGTPISFLVELWNDSNERVGYSSYEYSAVADHIFSSSFGGLAASIKPFAVTSASVPEPTSGLLMLIGMAGLALRRRRA